MLYVYVVDADVLAIQTRLQRTQPLRVVLAPAHSSTWRFAFDVRECCIVYSVFIGRNTVE